MKLLVRLVKYCLNIGQILVIQFSILVRFNCYLTNTNPYILKTNIIGLIGQILVLDFQPW